MNDLTTPQAETKTPGTRLLDLLAGWGRFVEADEQGSAEQASIVDAGLNGAQLADWYQHAAAEVMSLTGEEEEEAVRRWVLSTILPALLRPVPTPTVSVEAVSVAA